MRALALCRLVCTVGIPIGLAPSEGAAQSPICAEQAPSGGRGAPLLFYGSFGSATGGHRGLNTAIAGEGFAPLAENALEGGFGFAMTRGNGCRLIAVDLNVVQWQTRTAGDGRTIDFWATDLIAYVGAPRPTTGRTSVYPLVGLGLRLHFLDVTGVPLDRLGGSDPGPMTFARALHRDGEWEGPAQLIGDLGVGAHYLASAPGSRIGLVIGARMGFVLGPAYNEWIIGADTIHGPMVNTSGPYGRLTIGVSYRRRQAPPRGGTAPPSQPGPRPRRQPRTPGPLAWPF